MNLDEFRAYVEAQRKASTAEAMSALTAKMSNDWHEANLEDMGE